MSKTRARRIRRNRKIMAFILSVMLFVGVLSTAGVALAAELNTIRFDMRVTNFTLNDDIVLTDADTGATGDTQIAAVDQNGQPASAPASALPEVDSPVSQSSLPVTSAPPVTETTPNAGAAGYTTDGAEVSGSGATTAGTIDIKTDAQVITGKQSTTIEGSLVATDKDAFAGKDGAPTGDITQAAGDVATALVAEVKGILGTEYEEDTEYLIEKTDTTISADQSAKVITSDITEKTVKYKFDEFGNVITDPVTGKPVTEEVVVKAGAIEVEVKAEAAIGTAKVFEENVTVTAPVFKQKNVVLTVDVSDSMGKALDTNNNDRTDNQDQVKWAVMCDAVQTFVKELYGLDAQGNLPEGATLNKTVVLDLVLFSDASGLPITNHPGYDQSNAYQSRGKLDLSNTTDAEAITAIQTLLGRFTGELEKDRKANGYEEITLDLGLIEIPLNTTNGSNMDAGYNAALQAVETILKANDERDNKVAASDITVVFMTDGEATSYVSDVYDGIVVHKEEGRLNAEAREQAAEKAAEILAKGVNLVNVVVNGKAPREDKDDVDEKMNEIRDYMDPSYAVTTRTGDVYGEEIRGCHIGGFKLKKIGFNKIEIQLKPDDRDALNELKKDEHMMIYASGGKVYEVTRTDKGNENPTYSVRERIEKASTTVTDGTLNSLTTSDKGKYYENAQDAAKLTANRIKGELINDPLIKGTSTSAIKLIADVALTAYQANLISVVPAGFDVVVDDTVGTTFTVVGKDGAGNTVIEWTIDEKTLAGDFSATYYLLPNNNLGENYQFGTVLTNDSAIMFCNPTDGKGEKLAIVLDRPVLTLAADAGNDVFAIEDFRDKTVGDTIEVGSLMDNDSQLADKLAAYGTQVGDLTTAGSNNAGTRVAIQGGLTISFAVKTQEGQYAEPANDQDKRVFAYTEANNGQYTIYETTNNEILGIIAIDSETGKISFTKTNNGIELGVNDKVDIQIDYDLLFDTKDQKDAVQTLSTAAQATLSIYGGDPNGPFIPDVITDPDPIIPDAPDAPDGPDAPDAPDAPEAPVEPAVIEEEETPLEGPTEEADGATAADVETIPANATPLSGETAPAWALLNLILTLATGLASVLSLLGYIGKGKQSVRDVKKYGALRLISLIPGAGAVIAFLLTQNLGNRMVFSDQWTLLMAAIAVIQLGVVTLSIKRGKDVVTGEDK